VCDAAQELFHVREFHEPEAVAKTECAVKDCVELDMTHVTQHEINLRRGGTGVRRVCFGNKFLRDVDSRGVKAPPRELIRKSAVTARNIEHARSRLALKRFYEKVGLSDGLFVRNCLAPQVQRNAVKKIFEPICWDRDWMHGQRPRIIQAFPAAAAPR
jgi:hypothetical protein